MCSLSFSSVCCSASSDPRPSVLLLLLIYPKRKKKNTLTLFLASQVHFLVSLLPDGQPALLGVSRLGLRNRKSAFERFRFETPHLNLVLLGTVAFGQIVKALLEGVDLLLQCLFLGSKVGLLFLSCSLFLECCPLNPK